MKLHACMSRVWLFFCTRYQYNNLFFDNVLKIANLISKLNFYKLIPYPMGNCFTGCHDRSRQTTEKVTLYIIPAGPVTECPFARCHLVHTSCLDRMMTSFSLSKPIRP